MESRFRILQLVQISLLSVVWSVAQAAPGQFYLAPGMQWMAFDDSVFADSERGRLDDTAGFSASLGLQLTERWSIEAATFDLDPRSSLAGDVDVDHYRLDLIYDLKRSWGDWQPFLAGGIGNTRFGNENDTLAAIGGGFKYQLSDNVQWRTTLRSFQIPLRFLGRDQEDSDIGVDTALVFYFGGGDSASRRPPMTEPPEADPTPEMAPDADGDGVPDSGDACPDTPANYAVDERGCPIPVEEVARVELLVNFEFDSSRVEEQYFDEIQEIADFMSQYPDLIAELEGHTDSIGTQEYNQGLSERRAQAVKQVMVERFGIGSSRITVRGFGYSQPVTDNDTEAGRARNRRVVTVIIKTLQNYQPR